MIAPAIGLCWGTINQVGGLVEMIEIAARHGFATIQVTPDIYLEALEQGQTGASLRRQLGDAGVRVSVLDGISGELPGTPTEPSMFKGKRIERFGLGVCAEAAGALEAPIINVGPFMAKPVPLPEMAEAIGEVCRKAAGGGFTIALEFIPDSGVRSLAEALTVVQTCGEPNCAINVDTWHLTRTGSTAADLRALPPGTIAAMQLSDRKAPPPGEVYVTGTGRLLPGEGELPLADIVAAALANNPGISIETEVFSEELVAMTADAAAARAAAAIKAWRAGLA